MIKQIVLIISLSACVIFFKTQLNHLLEVLIHIHNYIYVSLHMIFSDGNVGRLIQDMISLLLIPFMGGLMVAMVFSCKDPAICSSFNVSNRVGRS